MSIIHKSFFCHQKPRFLLHQDNLRQQSLILNNTASGAPLVVKLFHPLSHPALEKPPHDLPLFPSSLSRSHHQQWQGQLRSILSLISRRQPPFIDNTTTLKDNVYNNHGEGELKRRNNHTKRKKREKDRSFGISDLFAQSEWRSIPSVGAKRRQRST